MKTQVKRVLTGHPYVLLGVHFRIYTGLDKPTAYLLAWIPTYQLLDRRVKRVEERTDN